MSRKADENIGLYVPGFFTSVDQMTVCMCSETSYQRDVTHKGKGKGN